MEDKIITETLKYVAENVANICNALEKSEHIIGLTRSQKLLTIAITDAWVYLEKGTLTITDLRNAVNYSLNGTVCLGANSQKHTYMSENKTEHLTSLTMQLGAMFYQDELGEAEPDVASAIIADVINRKAEIGNAIKQAMKIKNTPDIDGYIKLIDIIFSNEKYKTAIQAFKADDVTKTYTFVDAHDETHIEKIKRITVKSLIWLGILFVASFIFAAFALAGVNLGFIPTLIIYIPAFALCKKCGNIWDEHCFKKLSGTVTEKEEMKIETSTPQPPTTSENPSAVIEETPKIVEKEEVFEPQPIETDTPADADNTELPKTADPLSYKQQKKAVRAAYRAEKKKLKQENSKPVSNKGFKIAVAVLSSVLLISVIGNIAQQVYFSNQIADLESELNTEKRQHEYWEALFTQKKNDYDKLNSDYKKIKSNSINDFSKVYFLDNKLAFIDADSPYYYHTFDCEKFKNADSYYVHNIEYAESMGYVSHSCVIIKRNSK